ncbi:MAG: hypothetical protein RBR82_17555 [Pseudomonas sp.]|jgi:hypothetical protein|nr:hypothetical protein [Pseudomonas sp.]
MNTTTRRNIGRQRNTLLRYQAVLDEFEQHNCQEVPITVIWRKYIYPKYFISRQTLYRIFNTNVQESLDKVKQRGEQLKLF